MTRITRDKKPSGRHRAYSHIRDVILADPTAAGRFLNEQDLADEIGVSRTPVREALFMLATENLLQLVPNRGALVVSPSPEEIHHVMQAREMIEIWSVRHSIVDLPTIALGLGARLEAQRSLPVGDGFDAFIEFDRLFHLELIRFSGNAVLGQMYDVLQARHFTLGIKALARGAERRNEVLAEHEAIVEACANGSIDRVEAAIRTHLVATVSSLVAPR